MAVDAHDVPGLYVGTSTGQVFASADEGESWTEVASYLPAIDDRGKDNFSELALIVEIEL